MLKKTSLLRRLSVAAANLLIGLAITAAIAVIVARLTSDQNHKIALHTAEVYSARTESLLDSLFHKTDVLNAILIQSGGVLDEQTFQELASILDDGAGVRAVQCLPDGIVRYCYPLEGNENVMDTSVFNDPKRQKDAILAVETRSIALSGPYQLYQGGLGLVARNPVFINEDENEIFWGFTVIILDLPEAIEPILFSELTQEGYAYRLHCIIDTGEDMTITENGAVPEEDCIDYTIHVPNHVWTLSIMPEKGWSSWGVVTAILLAGALISILLSTIIYQWGERARVLREISFTDELTHLYNRRYLNETINGWCRGKTEEFCLLYMDLNRFKQINDTLGHRWGDILLEEAARRIIEAVETEIMPARVGGDEFVVATTYGPYVKEYNTLEERIRKVFEDPFVLDDKQVMIGVSIGYAHYPKDGTDFDTLIHKADHRMYKEKQIRCKGNKNQGVEREIQNQNL